MENYYGTSAYRADTTVQGMSILESDDVSDVSHQSHHSSRYDSGVYSLTYDSGCPSGLKSFGDAWKIRCDGATVGLVETLEKLALTEPSNAHGVTCYQGREVESPQTVDAIQESAEQFKLDLFRPDEDGDTQLHLAIIKPDITLAIQIIEIGQFSDRLDIQNDHQQTPLHLAVITNQPHLVRALVVSGASLMARDKHGNTPLHLACKLAHAQCVERLTAPPSFEEETYVWSERQRKGLQPQTTMRSASGHISLLNYEGDTCLHLAMASAADTKLSILDYLLSICGADVNAQEGKCGFTPLHQAVRSRDIQTVRFLLSQPNILVNQRCYNGYTPLDFALSLHQVELAQVLLSVGAVSFVNTFSAAESTEDEDFDDLVIAGGCFQR